MKNLLKWEMKQTFTSKAFWGTGAMLLLWTLILLAAFFSEGEGTGLDALLQGMNDYNSLLLLVIGIYAGIHVAGAFEERRMQAAVMAGYSRLKVLSVKLIAFSLAVAVFSAVALTACAVLAFSVRGLTGFDSFFREVVLRIAAYTLVEIAFTSLSFLISMLVKNVGASVAVSFVSLLTVNSLAQMLLEKEWADFPLRLIPAGQTFMLIADAGTKNLLLSAVASVLGLAVTMAVCYIKFRKEELK